VPKHRASVVHLPLLEEREKQQKQVPAENDDEDDYDDDSFFGELDDSYPFKYWAKIKPEKAQHTLSPQEQLDRIENFENGWSSYEACYAPQENDNDPIPDYLDYGNFDAFSNALMDHINQKKETPGAVAKAKPVPPRPSTPKSELQWSDLSSGVQWLILKVVSDKFPFSITAMAKLHLSRGQVTAFIAHVYHVELVAQQRYEKYLKVQAVEVVQLAKQAGQELHQYIDHNRPPLSTDTIPDADIDMGVLFLQMVNLFQFAHELEKWRHVEKPTFLKLKIENAIYQDALSAHGIRGPNNIALEHLMTPRSGVSVFSAQQQSPSMFSVTQGPWSSPSGVTAISQPTTPVIGPAGWGQSHISNPFSNSPPLAYVPGSITGTHIELGQEVYQGTLPSNVRGTPLVFQYGPAFSELAEIISPSFSRPLQRPGKFPLATTPQSVVRAGNGQPSSFNELVNREDPETPTRPPFRAITQQAVLVPVTPEVSIKRSQNKGKQPLGSLSRQASGISGSTARGVCFQDAAVPTGLMSLTSAITKPPHSLPPSLAMFDSERPIQYHADWQLNDFNGFRPLFPTSRGNLADERAKIQAQVSDDPFATNVTSGDHQGFSNLGTDFNVGNMFTEPQNPPTEATGEVTSKKPENADNFVHTSFSKISMEHSENLAEHLKANYSEFLSQPSPPPMKSTPLSESSSRKRQISTQGGRKATKARRSVAEDDDDEYVPESPGRKSGGSSRVGQKNRVNSSPSANLATKKRGKDAK
jgi:hypothetical protein